MLVIFENHFAIFQTDCKSCNVCRTCHADHPEQPRVPHRCYVPGVRLFVNYSGTE